MARCTLSACSELLLRALVVLGLISGLLPAQADVRWRAGVFPIAVFDGYTSHFGLRRGGDGQLRPHNGLDIAAPLGSPVLSWWSGHVVETINDSPAVSALWWPPVATSTFTAICSSSGCFQVRLFGRGR